MDILEKCKEVLLNNPQIIFAYVFGSYARGTSDENSDIDIAIYLNDKEMSAKDYLDLKIRLESICKRKVDLIILNESPPLLKYEVYLDGILLFTRDEIAESNFKVHTLFEYEDMKRYLDMSYNAMIRNLRKEVKEYGK
ncbi:type VII toxin-antitoxin system MntA family adenylyltransferase antitoxin [Caloranaerobacter ferrireducens]|uniref:type VII toxin-antitoxin system MntA family adenylyltransferase antitoxin n=1 Tax=Caloranaerobacter ferrireducens TaxID=1323370 RepID=UPI001FA7DE57|nr:nucleotidyltransferase domain-containing protein [Caloranaerobacter ferrireducens]